MKDQRPPCIGQVLVGPLFNEPMRVETVQASAGESLIVPGIGVSA